MKAARILAIVWTAILFVDICLTIAGIKPNWVLVYCPLIIVIWDRWSIYIKEKRNE